MKRMTKVWGMLCLAGLLISLYLGVSFLVPKQGKIILTFGMFSGNQSDVPNDDCYKIIDETIKEFEKEYAAKQKYEFDFNLDDKLFFTNSNLSLRDIFTEDMKKYDFAKEKISELKLEPKKKLHEELTKLAEEFHSFGDVKKLKNLNGTDKQTSPVIA